MKAVINHIIYKDESVRSALEKLDKLGSDAILFVCDDNKRLIGSLTDGDLRRGFINNLTFDDSILSFIQNKPISITRTNYTVDQLEDYRKRNFKIIPIVDDNGIVIDILNYRLQETIIPADGVLMAGGQGKRLMPLTEKTPKPLLVVGTKPIIEHNIDRLINVGIKNINLSINYLGSQLVDYFGDGSNKGARIEYLREEIPLGTIGSVLLANNFIYDDILVMNSDLLTNIDFTDFFRVFKESKADMAVATTSYHVDVPYAVLEVNSDNSVSALSEKPRYTYYSNAGIYFIKKELLDLIPKGLFYDITDLMDVLLSNGNKIITYPITGYWLDIGKHDDFRKAQEDIKHIKL